MLSAREESKKSNEGPGNLTLHAGVQVVCTRCYLKGNASVDLAIDNDFNITSYGEQLIDDVKSEVHNITDQVEDIFGNFTAQLDDRDWSNAEWPSFDNVSLDLSIPPPPKATLKFRFDDLDLYLEFDSFIAAGATYEIPLYQPFGMFHRRVGVLDLNVNFGVTLILAVEGEIDVSSGVHLKLDDGVELKVALFGDEISDVTL